MKSFPKQKETHRHRKQVYGYQRGKIGGEGGINWEFGINIYILLYIKQSVNKVLLYSPGNSTQHCNNLYEKRSWKRIDICITESLCYTLKLTQHCKSTILQYKIQIKLRK